MQYAPYALVVLIAFVIAAIAFDLKKRMIPNKLNYSCLAMGVAFVVVEGVFSLDYAAFVVLSFVFAYLVYKAGVWAGGDVKFFAALAAFFPLLSATPVVGWNVLLFIAIFAYSILAGVPVTLVVYAPKLWSLRREFASFLRSAAPRAFSAALASVAIAFALQKFFALVPQGGWIVAAIVVVLLMLVRIPLILSAIIFVIALALDPLGSLGLFAVALGISWLALFVWQSLTLVRKKVLRREVGVGELEEGMIPAYSIVVDEHGKAHEWKAPGLREMLAAAGKGNARVLQRSLKPQGRIVANSRLARGLTGAEIKELKALGIKGLVVRESLAFAPVMVAGFALAAVLGVKWIGL